MKTSVEVDEAKIKEAKKISGASTIREVIDLALESYIAESRRLQMGELLGTNFFEGKLKRGQARDRAR